MTSKLPIIANALLFQVGWFVSVLMGSLYAAIALPFLLAVHFIFVTKNKHEWQFIVLASGLGVLMDSVLYQAGILQFPGYQGYLVPLWLICLWVCFSLTIPHCLSWLSPYPLGAALLGAVGGAASYYAGHQLGAVMISGTDLVVIAVSWGLLLPLLYKMNQKMAERRIKQRVTPPTDNRM